ncbi:MAG: hypothetical protein LBF51_11335 [Zoogloeaceae bacterium]|nr:hypothetical protein [Zoogloeaceae bacterium]
MKKIIASVAALAVALTSCQTNAVEDESRQENSCARGDAQSCALLGDFHERDKTKTGRHDYAKAVEFYGKACALNEYAACADAARIHSFFRVDADSGKR